MANPYREGESPLRVAVAEAAAQIDSARIAIQHGAYSRPAMSSELWSIAERLRAALKASGA